VPAPASAGADQQFTTGQRFLPRLITWAGYLLSRILGPTLATVFPLKMAARQALGHRAPGIL